MNFKCFIYNHNKFLNKFNSIFHIYFEWYIILLGIIKTTSGWWFVFFTVTSSSNGGISGIYNSLLVISPRLYTKPDISYFAQKSSLSIASFANQGKNLGKSPKFLWLNNVKYPSKFLLSLKFKLRNMYHFLKRNKERRGVCYPKGEPGKACREITFFIKWRINLIIKKPKKKCL